MNRACLSILLPVTLVAPASAHAQGESTASATLSAITEMTKLFERALAPFRSLGRTAERDYVARELTALNADLYALERAKRDAVAVLSRPDFSQGDLANITTDVSGKLRLIRVRMSSLAPRLRLVDRRGTDSAIEQLDNAFYRKGDMLGVLIRTDRSTATAAIQDARQAIDALQACQRSVATLVHTLRS